MELVELLQIQKKEGDTIGKFGGECLIFSLVRS